MSLTQEHVVCAFFEHLMMASYGKAIDLMEKQHSEGACRTWPKSLIDVLCDFVWAEERYLSTRLEPVKNQTDVRKNNENYLDSVYKDMFQELEKIICNTKEYFTKLITTLKHYISIRLRLFIFYNQLYEVGSSNKYIDFDKLSKIMNNIQIEFSNPQPMDEILNMLKFEVRCMTKFLECHLHLEKWAYVESLRCMKKASDIFNLWEYIYQNSMSWQFGSFLDKNNLPALFVWFKKFKLMTISKFTLYFYAVLLQSVTLNEMKSVCSSYDLNYFSNMQELQKKSKAQSVTLVFDTSNLPDFRGPGYVSSQAKVRPQAKYQIMLSFPKVPFKLEVLEHLITTNNEGEISMNKIEFIIIDKTAYLLMRVDLRITLILFFNHKPTNEEKEKENVLEFVSLLRCHGYFTTLNKKS